jgi:hypothetical protein
VLDFGGMRLVGNAISRECEAIPRLGFLIGNAW